MEQKILIKNIKELAFIQEEEDKRSRLSGSEMNECSSIKNAWLAIENDLIVGYGTMKDWEGIADWTNLKIIDARDKIVLPAFCDSHSHIVYAGNREGEWVDRLKGLSYEEIANNGGGIINSALKLREASEDELYDQALLRAKEVISSA